MSGLPRSSSDTPDACLPTNTGPITISPDKQPRWTILHVHPRDDDRDNFETTDAYLYSRFKRCVFYRVTHVLDAHADEYDGFRFVLDTVDDGPIRSVGWARLRHALFETDDSPYINWGVLESVVEKLNTHYRTHGCFPAAYTDLIECPQPNGTLAYAPDKGDHHIYDLAVEDGEVVATLNAPDTLAPESYHDWTERIVHFPIHTRFHEVLAAGDGLGAPTLHASEHGYTLDVPVDVPETTVETNADRVLAVDLGVKNRRHVSLSNLSPMETTSRWLRQNSSTTRRRPNSSG